MKKLLPIILLVLGIGGGAGAGLMLKPAPQPLAENPCGPNEAPAPAAHEPAEEEAPEEEVPTKEYVKMNNQFIIPIVDEKSVQALVVLSLSLEVDVGKAEEVYRREPKLRDAFLQVLFDHANMGGFAGTFTNSNNLSVLRSALQGAASEVLGPMVTDVLIVDIARQDA